MRYACQIWGQITTNCTRTFRLQKQCLRLLTFSNFNSASSALFLELKILKLFDLIRLLNIVQIFQVLSDSAPSALINIYNLRKYPDSHLTRGTSIRLLTRPQCNTTKFGLNSVIYQSIVQWNELQTLYSGSDLAAFSKSELIKTYKSITFDEYWSITKIASPFIFFDLLNQIIFTCLKVVIKHHRAYLILGDLLFD